MTCPTSADYCLDASTFRDFTGGTCGGQGVCSDPYVDIPCSGGCVGVVCNNNPKPVIQEVTYTGSCTSGQTITLLCNVTDDQNPSTLAVTGWAGQCTVGDCVNTRSWQTGSGITYLNNAPIAYSFTNPSGAAVFTQTILINQPAGTGIAADCRAQDNVPQYSDWGAGRYPLCVVNGCVPPVITLDSIFPLITTGEAVTISFSVNTALNEDPTVTVRPTGQTGPGNPASKVSQNGNNYVYSYLPQGGDADGLTDFVVSVRKQTDLCQAQGTYPFTIDTLLPVTTGYYNGALSSYPAPIRANEVNVTFTCSDQGSGCAYTRYSIQNRTVTTPFTNYPPLFRITGTGEYNISYYSGDNAGHVEAAKKDTIMFYSDVGCEFVTCTAPEDTCIDETTLRRCTSSVCIEGVCVDDCQPYPCQYGCMDLPGDDICSPSARPVLQRAWIESTYQNYGRFGDTVNVKSLATAGGPLINLTCGTSQGQTDFCRGAAAGTDPMCSRTNPYQISGDYPLYCYVVKQDGARSLRTEVLTLTSDNDAPALVFGTIPNTSTIPPGTPFQVYAIAADALSGVNRTSIYFDGALSEVCLYLECNHTFTASYGRHNYSATAMDNVGNINRTGDSATGNKTISINNPPNITSNMTYTGECITGGQLTVHCTAKDLDQPSNTLTVRGWAGNCTSDNCFLSRGWAAGGITYMNGISMDPPATYTGGPATFTKTFTITQDSGTGVAGTCRATDELGDMNMPPEQGDAYPLCVVNGCTDPPEINIDYIRPNPTNVGSVDIAFTASRDLRVNPPVTVTPGSDAGHTTEYPAAFISRNGRSYVYRFDVIAGYQDGSALVNIRANAADNNCPRNEITTFIIDKTPPVITPLCNLQTCIEDPYVYRSPLVITFACSDLTGCNRTFYGINANPITLYTPLFPPTITATGNYTLQYAATDYTGNLGSAANKKLKVYNPCYTGPTGTICYDEEVRVHVELDKHIVYIGDPATGMFYCFLRDKQNKGIKTRECSVLSNGIDIVVDRGTTDAKDYFNRSGTTPGAFLGNHTFEFGQDTPVYLDLDSIRYQVTRGWSIDLDTNIFHSTLCINMTDSMSGINGEDCTNYTVTDTKINPNIIFPDVIAGVVPYTSDRIPPQQMAPNFTKGMALNFWVRPYLSKLVGPTTLCTGVNCRVEFSFLSYGEWGNIPPRTAPWSAFDNAYVPETEDILSNDFGCDQYQTLYTRTWIQGGPYSGMYEDNYSDIFISCDTKVTVNPREVRLAVGQSAGKIFDVSIWNPTNNARSFDLDATSIDALGYPLQWIHFDCAGAPTCVVGPSDDHLHIDRVPPLQEGGSSTVQVIMDVAVKSGAFPVTFIAEDTVSGDKYVGIGNILVFSEGLEEFAVWQLIVLVGAAAAYFVFFV